MAAKLESAINTARDWWLKGADAVEAHPHVALGLSLVGLVNLLTGAVHVIARVLS